MCRAVHDKNACKCQGGLRFKKKSFNGETILSSYYLFFMQALHMTGIWCKCYKWKEDGVHMTGISIISFISLKATLDVNLLTQFHKYWLNLAPG